MCVSRYTHTHLWARLNFKDIYLSKESALTWDNEHYQKSNNLVPKITQNRLISLTLLLSPSLPTTLSHFLSFSLSLFLSSFLDFLTVAHATNMGVTGYRNKYLLAFMLLVKHGTVWFLGMYRGRWNKQSYLASVSLNTPNYHFRVLQNIVPFL